MNLRIPILCTLSAALTAGASLALFGCGKNSPLNADAIGDAIGGSAGNLVKASGHEATALALDEKDEDNIGQAVGVQLTNRYGVFDDAKAQKYVSLVGLTVASASPNPGGNYVFGILNTSEVNAFSGPNGYVLITRGALMNMRDEAELAGVLGHEIAHVCHHDGLNQVKAAEHQAAISNAIAASDRAGQFSQLADMGVDAITKSGYTQPQEFAADDDGVKYMSAAGYDPRSYLNFLRRMQTMQGTSSGGQVMSTHPDIADRVNRVQKEIDQMGRTGAATLAMRFNQWVGAAPGRAMP